jgi:hypothetical protein
MKNKLLCFIGKWMKLVIIMLSEISSTQKDKYHMFYLVCGIEREKEHEVDMKVGGGQLGKKKRFGGQSEGIKEGNGVE